MKRNKLDSFVKKISVPAEIEKKYSINANDPAIEELGIIGLTGTKHNYFVLVDNPQYVDFNNLEKYTIRDLKSICWELGKHPSGRGWTKSNLIELIKSADKSKMIQANREILINNIIK